MKERTRQMLRVTARGAVAATVVAATGAASGCLNRPIQPIDPLTTSVVVEQLTQSGVNKIDLVLAVDNSASMADKQAVLALAVPDLINGLVNPQCLDNATGAALPTSQQPTSPTATCPAGSTRDFPPVLDIHIGLVSSSLGTFGGASNSTWGCPDHPPEECMTADTTPLDDHGHLVTRSSSCNTDGPVPTFNSEGFLAWNPQSGAPAGSIGTVGAVGQSGTLVGSVSDLVVGNGQEGCGFESQDESWYRFLVDPAPYASITFTNGSAVTSGTDTALLTQRAQFLRPDSLLAIVLLSDETDTSIKEYSAYPVFGDEAHLPHPSSLCNPANGGGPTNKCCYSCGEATPAGCTPDPICKSNPNYSNTDENLQIRAFGLIEHKQNYGIEFFYPTSRYINALQAQTIEDSAGNSHPNPIFTNLNPSAYTGAVRDTSLVFYAAIVGVPWQLIARQTAAGVPDLVTGVDDIKGSGLTGGFKTAAELSETDKSGKMCSYNGATAPCTYWDDIAGDPDNYVKAQSPFMQESSTPRTGTDPITGVSPASPSTPNGSGVKVGNSSTSPTTPVEVNDHEWNVPTPPGDIQYACIFPLGGTCSTDSDCLFGVSSSITCVKATGASTGVCGRDENPAGLFPSTGDCYAAVNPSGANKPLCSPNPNDSTGANSLQTSAKAYPGIKELAIARGMGGQGIAASICPAQLSDNTQPDFGYRPAVTAIINRLKQALHGECLPRQLTEVSSGTDEGQVPCLILEGTKVANTSDCTCNATARAPVPADQQAAVSQAEQTSTAVANGLNCFCEITQLTGSDLNQCQTDTSNPQVDGWCYVDAAVNAQQALVIQDVSKCPADNPHNIRFLGNGNAVAGSTLFITCAGD